MRNLITLLGVCLLFSSCIEQKYAVGAAGYPNPFEFETIDSMSGSKNEIFANANEWVAKTFNSAKDVIQMNDKEAGRIIAKGVMESDVDMGIAGISDFFVSFTMSIYVKDGKTKIDFTDFILTDQYIVSRTGPDSDHKKNDPLSRPLTKGVYAKAWNNIKGDCQAQTVAMTNSFKTALRTTKKDW